jgi:hypothetical protein
MASNISAGMNRIRSPSGIPTFLSVKVSVTQLQSLTVKNETAFEWCVIVDGVYFDTCIH